MNLKSTASMDFSCFHCNTNTQLNIQFELTCFSCPKCKTLYTKNNEGQFTYKEQFKCESYTHAFDVGAKGVLEGVEYTITGVLIKSHAGYKWAEYILQSEAGHYRYLSESQGNFILLEEVSFDKKVGNHPMTVTYKDMVLDRYDYYHPYLEYALGFFDFNVLEKMELIEYINPPYILSFEKTGQEQVAFFGSHISRHKIKRAFDTTLIPSKSGMGMVQPFVFNIRNLVIIFSSVAILILLSHWFLNKDRVQKEVLNVELAFDSYSGKDFISPSFELQGSSAPLEINLYSPVDNSWANVQVALINENSGEEIYASKDVEYYHGYTDGENWSEGGPSNEFNICGVKEGKYHLAITPMKAPEDYSNTMIRVIASWNRPSLRNVIMVFIFMGVFVLGIFYLSKHYENKRWGDYEH